MKYFLTKLIVPVALLFTLFTTTACLGETTDATASTNTTATTSVATATAIADITANYSAKDLNASWDDAASAHITLTQGAIASDTSEGVTISDNTVTITAAGSYVLSGTLTDGQIVVSAGDKDDVQLILQNVTIANTTTSPIYVKSADKTILTLPDGSVNTITDSASYTFAEGEDEPDAAIFSKDDLSINGNGTLIVKANYRNGIASKDDLTITGGNIQITAVNDALRGRDSIAVKDGKLTLVAGGDGMKSNQDSDGTKGWICLDGGEYNITAENDGIQAETVLKINDGKYTITTGGGSENAVAKTNQNTGMGGRGGGMRANRGGTPPDGGTPFDGRTLPDGGAPFDGGTPPDGETPFDGRTPPDGGAPPNGGAPATTATTTETESMKGLKAVSALIINGGTFALNTNDDAVHSNGSVTIFNGAFTISTGDDAFHADTDLTIHDGNINISTCYEGLEGATVTINGGDIDLVASDDGINAAGGTDSTNTGDSFRSTGEYYIRITGGNTAIDAGGDGIDSNRDLFFDGGTVIVHGATSGADSPLDFDGKSSITGGTLIAAGSAGMAQAPGDASTQNTLMITYTETQAAGTMVHLEDSSGNTIISFTPKRNYQSVVVSAPQLTQGETYQLYTGGSDSGQETGGLYTGGGYTGGTKLTDITLSGLTSSVSSDGTTIAGRMTKARP